MIYNGHEDRFQTAISDRFHSDRPFQDRHSADI